MTFEQLYAPIFKVDDESDAKRCLDNIVILTMKRYSWDNTPSNRARAEELVKEELYYISSFEKPAKAAQIRRLFFSHSELIDFRSAGCSDEGVNK